MCVCVSVCGRISVTNGKSKNKLNLTIPQTHTTRSSDAWKMEQVFQKMSAVAFIFFVTFSFPPNTASLFDLLYFVNMPYRERGIKPRDRG